MARFAVGDLQGNLTPLRQLLSEVGFQPGKDELWLVGDIVNRGPESLASLRFVKDHDHCARMVLGNHDLSLLAKGHGIGKPSKRDTITDILNAPDQALLFDFLYQQPLAISEDDWLMTHAGLPPIWSDDQALALSDEISALLTNRKARQQYFETMFGDHPKQWQPNLSGEARWRAITNYFTRMRFCNEHGELDLSYSGALNDAPAGMAPWFSFANPHRKRRLVFGHWAALMGATGSSEIIGLDTGYVWGNQMTLMNLDSGQRYQVQAGWSPSH